MTQQRFLCPSHQDPGETPTPVCLKVGGLEHRGGSISRAAEVGLHSPTGTPHEVRLPKPMVTWHQRQDDTYPDTDLKVTWVSAMTDLLLSLSSPSVVSGPATPWTAAHWAPVSFTAPPHRDRSSGCWSPRQRTTAAGVWRPRPRLSARRCPQPRGGGQQPSSCPMPCLGDGTHRATWQPQTQGDASHPAHSRSNSPY